MRLQWLASCFVLLGVLAPRAHSDSIVDQRQLVDAVTAMNPNAFLYDRSFLENVTLTNGDPTFKVLFNGMWSVFGLRASVPWNWSQYNGLSLIVENMQNRPVSIGIRADFTPDIRDPSLRQAGKYIIPPYAVRRIVLELDPAHPDPHDVRALPAPYSAPHVRLFGANVVDRSKAYQWLVSLNENTSSRLLLREIRLIRNEPVMAGSVDDFGQTTGRTWPGKVASVADMQGQLTQENLDLDANPGPTDIYGPPAPPSSIRPGKWSVARLGSGKWYLVTPAGKLFWTFGITTATYDVGTPQVGREYLFQDLPPQSGPAAAHYGSVFIPGQGYVDTFNYYSYNLERKYGPTWQSSFLSHTLKRVKSWGFNTLSDWAHRDLRAMSDIPYLMGVNTNDYPRRLIAPYRDGRLLPDAFASDFKTWLTTKISTTIAGHNGRPQFLGVYVDGELKWANPFDESTRYQVAVAALNASSSQAAKTVLIQKLKSRYRTVSRLNASWGTNFGSWTTLNNTNVLPNPSMGATMKRDFAEFATAFAAAYYSKVRAALQAVNFTGLYLGGRDSFASPEFIAQANRYVDVFSVGYYTQPEFIDWTFPGITRPVLIYEFSFGAVDRGCWHPGPAQVYDQAERAARMVDYYRAALAAPKVVGAHWFQYADQPVSGRFDGENFNAGFVSQADTPFPEMVAGARLVGNNLYDWRGF